MVRNFAAAMFALGFLSAATLAEAADCPGNANALGTSRTIAVDPAEHPFVGGAQYAETLPLVDREIVLTFDDGPAPPFTEHVLNTLASECVKATFFVVGRMARAYPDTVRRIHAEGHTIGTHSQNHPLIFDRMAIEQVQQEVETGIASATAALGDTGTLAPFFRIPGLARSPAVDAYLQQRGLMTWSIDFDADDYRRIGAPDVVARALRRAENKGRGILLLHDPRAATMEALPALLRELKARGFRIVHVVPADAGHPRTNTPVADWTAPPGPKLVIRHPVAPTTGMPIASPDNVRPVPAARANEKGEPAPFLLLPFFQPGAPAR